MDATFAAQREFSLLTELAQALSEGSEQDFTDKLFNFDRVNKLDNWKTTMFLRVKNHIQEEEDDLS